MDNENTLGQGAQTGGHDHPAREGHKPDCGCGHDHHADGHAGHDHGPDCGCEGHDHHAGHDHGPDCGCEGHDHHAGHDHGSDCGCGEHAHAHHHGSGCGCEWHEHDDVTDGPDYDNGLSIAENNVLMALLERGGLPVARFALTSSREKDAYTVAMGPVYIADPEESLDTIRGYGAIYAEMEHKGLIDLDYDCLLYTSPSPRD